MFGPVLHKSFNSYYLDPKKDLFGLNTDTTKVQKMMRYSYPWWTKDGPPTKEGLKDAMIDNFADHNVGGIGIFVFNGNGNFHLKVIVGLKKYTKDPSSQDSPLFSHS